MFFSRVVIWDEDSEAGYRSATYDDALTTLVEWWFIDKKLKIFFSVTPHSVDRKLPASKPRVRTEYEDINFLNQ